MTTAFSSVLWLFRFSLHLWFHCQCSLRLGCYFSVQSVPFELTTAKWDVETSGKTVLVGPDWGELTEQRNSGDRAAFSVVIRVFQVDYTIDIVKTLCDLSGVRCFPTLKLEILVLWRITTEAWIFLLRKFATENFECVRYEWCFLLVRLRAPLALGSALWHS